MYRRATDLALDFTFYPGTASNPTMRFWLDGTQLDVPADIAATCRALPRWQQYYPDQQLRLILVQLLAGGYTDSFTPGAVPPPAAPYRGRSKQP